MSVAYADDSALYELPMAVPSRTKNETVFLVISEVKGGLKITPATLSSTVLRVSNAGRALNQFWPMWLQSRLLNSAVQLRVQVEQEVRDGSLIVRSKRPIDEWLDTVVDEASRIVPLRKPPMKRRDDGAAHQAIWSVDVDAWNSGTKTDIHRAIDGIRLPDEYSIYVGYSTINVSLHGTRGRKTTLPISIVKRMVEMHVTLAFNGCS